MGTCRFASRGQVRACGIPWFEVLSHDVGMSSVDGNHVFLRGPAILPFWAQMIRDHHGSCSMQGGQPASYFVDVPSAFRLWPCPDCQGETSLHPRQMQTGSDITNKMSLNCSFCWFNIFSGDQTLTPHSCFKWHTSARFPSGPDPVGRHRHRIHKQCPNWALLPHGMGAPQAKGSRT